MKQSRTTLAKQYNCDYRTIEPYFEIGMTGDLYKALILQITSDFMEDLNMNGMFQVTKEPPFKRLLKEKGEQSNLPSICFHHS